MLKVGLSTRHIANRSMLYGGGGGPAPPSGLYSDDVFSAYTYTATGSPINIVSGLDLLGQGGLVWEKIRNSATSHYLSDTVRGTGTTLSTDNTTGNTAISNYVTFNNNGYSVGTNAWSNTTPLIGWQFRKAANFFDVVTYTGNGTNRTIAHNLGVAPGMIITKKLNSTSQWCVYHRGLTDASYYVLLNATSAQTAGATLWNSTAPTSSVFSVGTNVDVNNSGDTYVAYLFAHDATASGIVQCGSYTGNGASAGPLVTLGWEPQFVLIKCSTQANSWPIADTSRGASQTNTLFLYANSSGAEGVSGSGTGDVVPTAIGFSIGSSASFLNNSGQTYIYLAIRRPNKPPTLGTQVYNAIARTGTGAAANITGVGFAPDLAVPADRSKTTSSATYFIDRLRGGDNQIVTNTTAAEGVGVGATFRMDGILTSGNGYFDGSGGTYINWFFKRAPGVFDEVCYTGTGAGSTIAHGLGVVPELIIVKKRSSAANWSIYCKGLTDASYVAYLNLTNAQTSDSTYWNNTLPTSSVFSIGNNLDVSSSGSTFVAYLFATLTGISKVGSYTGNGSSQTIACGFSTGARFILIKRTDSTGDWFVWDSVRGIVAGNDPHLSLNTTVAEVTTDDSVDTDNSGFIVNQLAATNINVNAGTYIFLAIA